MSIHVCACAVPRPKLADANEALDSRRIYGCTLCGKTLDVAAEQRFKQHRLAFVAKMNKRGKFGSSPHREQRVIAFNAEQQRKSEKRKSLKRSRRRV